MQENSDFFRYFQFRGRSWGELQFRVRGEEYPNMIRENKHKKETVLGNESTFLGTESTFLGKQSTVLGSNLKKQHFCGRGVESVVSRSSLGRRAVF